MQHTESEKPVLNILHSFAVRLNATGNYLTDIGRDPYSLRNKYSQGSCMNIFT